MKYIMVTNWDNHWNHLPNNRTLFTLGMLREGMSKDKLINDTETMFIKKSKLNRTVERCWKGKVYNLIEDKYKYKEAIYFQVKIDEEIFCPEKYKSLSEGWYCPEALGVTKKEGKNANESFSENKKIDSSWPDIQNVFGVSKHQFGRKINFVKSKFERGIIFRDVEQACILLKMGFYKPAVILAGSVIEELLRFYLKHKGLRPAMDTFGSYVQCCKDHSLFQAEIHNLTDASRYFRNTVHLAKESSSRHSISKSIAIGTIASIFTIIDDF